MILFFSFFVIELQTSSCFLKVSLLRAWNLSPRLGIHELKLEILFSIIWLNLKLEAIFWRFCCQELEIWAQDLAYMRWNFEYFFFILCDWTSNLKLYYERRIGESLKSNPRIWLTWGENLNFFFCILYDWTSNLKLYYEGLFADVLWRSCCRELESWAQGLLIQAEI